MGNYPLGQFPIFFILSNKDRKEKNKMSTNNNRVINDCRFYPVQGPEEVISNLAPQEGYVYFTTDTKKIFLGQKNEKIPMCSATGFYYGTKEIPKDDSGAKPDPNVDFHITEIEGSTVPEVDDLILNIDGCFYRVKGIEADTIKTLRLTLQGTGGGGGSVNPDSGGVDFEIQPSSINKTFSSTASSMVIEFTPYKYNPPQEDAYITYISCTMDNSTTPFFEKTFESNEFRYNQKYSLDLIDYISNFSTATAKTFTLQVKDIRQNSHSIKCKIQLVELTLRATQDEIIYSSENSYLYGCYFGGGVGLSSRKLTFTFYNENDLTKPVYTLDYPNTINGDITKTLELPNEVSHGVYKLTVQGSGFISGGEKIESNIIEHKFIRFDASKNEPILAIALPSKLEQYTNIPLKMLFLTNGANKEYNIDIKVDNKNITTQTIVSGELLTYPLTFDDMGEYTLTVSIPQLNLIQTQRLVIKEYTGHLPTIKTTRDDLLLYLNPRGKTNNAIDRTEWQSSNDNTHVQPIAQLDNFYFGEINGWFMDEASGTSYLRLNQGANLTIPNFEPFNADAMDSANHGMTIELDFKISAVTDYDADIIRCMSVSNSGVPYCGFRITGNRAELYTSINNGTIDENGVELKPFTVKLLEDQRIKISYVIEKKKKDFYPLILTYFNGIISSIDDYDANDHFVQNRLNPAILSIDSSNAQIDLYSIRVYSGALDQTTILENYQASLGSLAEREASYNSNNILDNNQLDLRLIEAEDYPLEIPYVKITGGFNSSKEMVMGVPGSENGFGLPIGKKDYRLISFDLKYPKTGYFADNKYQDFSEICTFESGKDETDRNPAYGETPLTGAIMYAQGTSSLEYPVKNLRVKFKTKKIAVRPDLAPVNLICLKADYMESSGSHNTGAANYVDEVYKQAGMKTPGQAYYSDENIVTSIKGHPVLVFWSTSGLEGTYQYIGKYNLNLDKATPEPFGFKNDPEEYDANAEKKFGWDENGKNTIRCFEYLDNDEAVCNFQAKPDKTYEETWYELITDPNTGKSHYGWTEGFESRHPEDLDGKTDADDIYPMAKWVNELHELSKTDKDQAVARFANEYECYFNKDFLLAYYSITNLLLMIDSRTKNCMMASWGPEGEKSYYPLVKNADGKWVPDETQEPIVTNYFIWYPIFYDMDTMLGLDNQGHQNKNYYDTDADPGIFNGKQILWSFVREGLPAEITDYYERFESAGGIFTASKIIPFFNNNQASLANEAMYNEDAEYKYINPFRDGYYDYKNVDADGNPTWIKGGDKDNKLFAAQGSRDLDREYFIKNRVNFLRGKYQSPKFLQEDRIEFRAYTPAAAEDDENYTKIQNTLAAVPFDGTITLEALGPGFGGIKYGNTIPKIREFTKNNLSTTIEFPSVNDGKNDQETYIYGLSNLKDVGDLSNKYPATFVITAENKLEIIKLGNDHKDYFNPYWQLKASSVDFSNCPLLKILNMYNCTYSSGLDLSMCKQLEDILLTGSSVSSLTLPEGTVIKNLRLPGTLETLSVKNQRFLENFSFGKYEYGSNEEHMTNNDHYVNNFERIRYAEIIDTPAINSYDIVVGAPELQRYKFTNVDWHITQNDTQYVLISENEFDSNTTYYVQQGNNFVEYEGTSYQLGLFRKVVLINSDGTITQIPALEKLMTLDPMGGGLQGDALTGKITIDVEGKIDDLEMYNKYIDIFPNLKITYGSKPTVDMAHEINFYYGLDADNMGSIDISNIKSDKMFKAKGDRTIATIIGDTELKPHKNNTPVYNYYFSGRWFDWNSAEKPVYYQDYRYTEYGAGTMDTPTGEYYYWDAGEYKLWDRNIIQGVVIYTRDIPDNSFLKYKPTAQMDLVPEFIGDPVKYYVTCVDGAGNSTFRIFTYDEPFSGYDEPTMRYVAKSCTGLADDEHYVFRGWITEKDHNDNNPNPTLIDFTKLRITEDMTIYSYFTVEKIAKTSAPTYLFNIRETQVSINGKSHTLMSISLNDDFAWVWGSPQGDTRIVLPTHTSNGTAIKVIGNFATQYQDFPVNIYFTEGSEYEFIQDGAFADNTQVHEVHLPDTIKAIGDRAFYGAKNVIMSELPTGLTTLGKQAFTNAEQITISKLPVGIDNLGLYTFVNCHNLQLSSIGEEGNEVLVGNAVFMGAKVTNVTSFTFGPRVTIAEMTDANGIFHRAYPNLNTVICYNYAGCGSEEE